MIPCVILASTPLDQPATEDLEAMRSDYMHFMKGRIRFGPPEVLLRDPGDQDGGNGTGREPGGGPLRPEIGTLGKTFYDFMTHPDSEDREVKFPPILRFELCLPFADFDQAVEFLLKTTQGQRLGQIFKYVQIVAMSVPTFVGTPAQTDESAQVPG